MPFRLFIFALLLLAAAPVQAAEQRLRYELYAAGLDAVEASATIRETGPAYSIDLSAQTRGLLGRIVPWQGSFHSEGDIAKNGMPQPLLHVSTAKDRKHTEVKTYRYDAGGIAGYDMKVDGRDKTPEAIDKTLTDATTDALSAAFAAMRQMAAGKGCTGASEIFDGDRRYRLLFHDMGRDMLKASAYTAYDGPAEKCTAEVVKLNGKWSAKPRGWLSIQEQGRKFGSLPLLWLAAIEPGGAAVPVKVQVTTEYGTLVMHVARYQNDRNIILDGSPHGYGNGDSANGE